MIEKLRQAGVNIIENEPMSRHTTFRIGGPAWFFATVKTEDEIIKLVEITKSLGLKYYVIGAGSNLLVSDKGFKGLVIKIFGGEIKIENEAIVCDAGVSLTLVMNRSLENNLIGLEWSIGIPGSIGGAVRGNAGAYGGDISQVVESVRVLRQGEIKELSKADCKFGYRSSIFNSEGNHDVILSVKLKLQKADTERIAIAKETVKNILSERKKKFCCGPSAGSTFKNVVLSKAEIKKLRKKFPEMPEQFIDWQKIPSAWLIDQCELRNRQVGGAKVSEAHAGIVVNAGGATAEDIIMLTSIVKQKVRSKFNLQLMEEIEYLGI